MRHSWVETKVGKISLKLDIEGYYKKPRNIKRCKNCNLLRGYLNPKGYGFALLCYFNDDSVLLSTDTLPYKCIGKKENVLITKEELLID
jgi:hypothetical protein